jgi:hypothetical protein
MDHLKAVNDRSAERYLLGEMSDLEAEEFEHHYFECAECALAVEAGEVFVANARTVWAETEPEAVGKENAPEAPRESFWGALTAWWTRPATMIPAVASLALAALCLYQGASVIPGLRQSLGEARVLPAFTLIGASRGEASQITLTSGTPSFAVSVDIPPDVHFPRYLCYLSEGGRTVFELNAEAPAGGQPITILVPAKDLQAGPYELGIYGADLRGHKSERVSIFAFALKFR